MTLLDYLLQGWNGNPVVVTALVGATALYFARYGRSGRPILFLGAVALAAIGLLSPLNLLATGVLFSAHMAQHILLLLLIPGLVLLSLPSAEAGVASLGVPGSGAGSRATGRAAGRPSDGEPAAGLVDVGPVGSSRRPKLLPLIGWFLGVGSMWFWHVPSLCNAAATRSPVHAVQTLSLLTMGAVFWWPILAPDSRHRLLPGFGILYLFTACLACTGLGVLLTLTPVEVCPAFREPTAVAAMWSDLRLRLSAGRDQQIGGLLMWMPMCLVYVAAIVLEMTRWLGGQQDRAAQAGSPLA